MKKDNDVKANPMRPSGGHGPKGMFGGPTAKAKDFKGTVKKLSGYLKPFWFSIIVVLVFSIAATVFSIFSPKILGRVTNTVVDDYIDMMIYDRVIGNISEIQSPSSMQENVEETDSALLPITLPEGFDESSLEQHSLTTFENAGETVTEEQLSAPVGPEQMFPEGTMLGDIMDMLPKELLEQIPEGQLERFESIRLDKRPSIDFDSIKDTAILLISLYVLSFIANYIQGLVMSNVSQKVSFKLRRQISEKINKLPLRYYDSQSFGDILSRITNDVDTVSQSLSQSITQLISSITTVIGIAIMMLTISWQLTLVAFTVFPISIGFIGIIIKKSQGLFKRMQDSLGEINGHIEENYSGHSIVKVFNGEEESQKTFNNINVDLYDSSWKSQFLSGLLFPIINFIGNIGFVGVSVLGGWLAINKGLQIGDIQAFIQYVQQFNQPIVQLGNIVNVLQSAVASAERVFEFLEEEEQVEDIENPVSVENIKGNVDFVNIVFGYEKDKPVIKGFDANLKAGQSVAIVGPTGAGKTTMVNLLMRFYDVDSGSIRIDGVDIRNYRRSDLRRLFGMVLQDTWLFHGTIRENLTYGKPEATEEELRAAVEAAHIDHVIDSLPGGFEFEISEDSDNVSQGEKQLLTIARAMVANPPMLILDEATSSVDTRTEILIQKAMDNLMNGRTSFVIAHRLSTIKNADLILVMKDGNIIEKGNHEELMNKNGFYAELYNSQFEV